MSGPGETSGPEERKRLAEDERTVGEFGYRQELSRSLSWFSLFSVSFSIMSIATGVFLNFTFGMTHLGPVSIWIWPMVGVGQLLVALVISELGTRIPLAGAGYQWGARLIGPGYGWFIGALGILYAAVGVPGIVYLAVAPLTEYVLGIDGASPRMSLFIALLVLTVAYLVNIVSVQLAARINNVAVLAEILGTVVLALLLFFLWVAGTEESDHGIGYLTEHHLPPGHSYGYAIALASLVGVYTLAGFEAAADVAEEAVDAKRSVPRAILGSVVVSVVLGMLVLIGFTVAVPSDEVLAAGGLPAVFQYWLGEGLSRTFVGVVVFAMFALMVVSAAVIARLLFAMARDNVLPGSALLRRVNPTTKTPVPALLTGYVLNVAVLLFGHNSSNAFGTLVGATAVLPYLVYLLIVVAYGYRRRRLEAIDGAFDLGRFAGPVFGASLVYLVAVLLTLTLPDEFRSANHYVLGGLALAAVWWLVGLRPRLARGSAGAPVLGGPAPLPDGPLPDAPKSKENKA
ncbi:amino acid permease [Streptomyces cinereoruber]|uniref:Amino acid permease n=1 Tax=Streptomyces cinereoruber TaxID=67260 RepID=A0AAV4KBT5_9ACTN|nr:amino acid permease [Streptomyces cinereoruber]MBB4161252.1 amino acid transporter [Streptomyces cinereoruber]MBY8819789.1 amino acid permease [Streptomyces cinereoruber]NIH63630.1 amino acid transporter [Streptomyces cinereoruber]QEV36250.1 amino acid permease [Streptomyces cinereoruber]GGR11621.1 amino acid permease [Streptomyces cinereoruber]